VNRLTVEASARDGFDHVVLRGTIDEHSPLAGELWPLRHAILVLTLARLSRINSSGVREWVRWMSELTARGVQVVLCECSPAVVSQLNMTANFAPGARIESFVVPFFCTPCSDERLWLVHRSELGADLGAVGAVCPICGAILRADPADLEFLRRTVDVRLPPAVESAVAELWARRSEAEGPGDR